jgi:PAH dioxygenase large subunit
VTIAPPTGAPPANRVREVADHVENGNVPTFIYNDPQLFELEQKKLFSRAWMFLAHRSEVPNPGDFVVRSIGRDSVIVIRGDDGEVRAFLNSCRHRGAKLCNAEVGSFRSVTCIYHGWSYNREGKLTGVPFGRAVYKNLPKGDLGLTPVAQVDQIEGLIFGCLDPGAPSLLDYLGDLAPYLQLSTRRSTAGLEVVGYPQRWIVEVDWKIPTENLVGDAYHTPFSHHSAWEIGLWGWSSDSAQPGGTKVGVHVQAGNGDFAMAQRPHDFTYGYPPSMLDVLRSQVSPEMAKVFDEGKGDGLGTWPTRWSIFPNFSAVNLPMVVHGEVTPLMSFRVWQPVRPGVTEAWSWCLVEADAAAEFKERSSRAYTSAMGPSGMVEQDDMENWRTITAAAVGEQTREMPQYVRMGDDLDLEPIADWPGPGTAWPTQYFDLPTKTFLKRWAQWLSR